MSFFCKLLLLLAIGASVAASENKKYTEALFDLYLQAQEQAHYLEEWHDRSQQQRSEGIKEFQLSKQMTGIKDPIAKKND